MNREAVEQHISEHVFLKSDAGSSSRISAKNKLCDLGQVTNPPEVPSPLAVACI